MAKDEPKSPGEKVKKKPLKLSMEAMIRGFEKYLEEDEGSTAKECSHTVAAWHNVPHPLVPAKHCYLYLHIRRSVLGVYDVNRWIGGDICTR